MASATSEARVSHEEIGQTATDAKSEVTPAEIPALKIWQRLDARPVPIHELKGVEVLAELVARGKRGHPRHSLFLGAGASATSGVALTSELVDRWRRLFYRDRHQISSIDLPTTFENDYGRWLRTPATASQRSEDRLQSYELDAREWEKEHGRHPSEYAFLFSFIAPQPFDRQALIEKEIDHKEPGPGYIYLASLVREGWFKTILTTNFDDLVHDVLFRYADVRPLVVAFDSQLSAIHPSTSRPVIVKLHGDFMYNNIRNVATEVQRLSENMRDKLRQTCKTNGLVVIGYGGGDESIMTPLQGMLHDGNCLEDGLHWCVYAPPGSKEVAIPGEVWRLRERHPDKVYLYWAEGADQVLEVMYSKCACSPPPDLDRPRERSLFQRLNKALLTTDNRYKVSDQFNELLKRFLDGDHEIRPWYLQAMDVAEYLFCSAKSKSDRGYHAKTKPLLTGSVDFCDWVLLGTVPAHPSASKIVERHPALKSTASSTSPNMPHATPELRPNSYAIAQAFKRKAGAQTQYVEEYLLDRSVLGNVKDLEQVSDLRLEILKRAEDALNSARCGISLARKDADCSDHHRALAYNALVAYSYIRIARNQPLNDDELREVGQLEGDLRARDPSGEDLRSLDQTSNPKKQQHGWWLVRKELNEFATRKGCDIQGEEPGSPPSPSEES